MLQLFISFWTGVLVCSTNLKLSNQIFIWKRQFSVKKRWNLSRKFLSPLQLVRVWVFFLSSFLYCRYPLLSTPWIGVLLTEGDWLLLQWGACSCNHLNLCCGPWQGISFRLCERKGIFRPKIIFITLCIYIHIIFSLVLHLNKEPY